MGKKRVSPKGIAIPVVGFSEEEYTNIEDLPGEEWRPFYVNGLLYYISSLGRIKSPKRIIEDMANGSVRHRVYKAKILRGNVDKYGYVKISISKHLFALHRLVAKYFIGDSQMEVNHKNGNKLDNRLSNLEYCTHTYNMRHAFNTGLIDIEAVNTERSKKAANVNRKITKEQALVIYKQYTSKEYSQKELAQIYHVNISTINRICRRIKNIRKNV